MKSLQSQQATLVTRMDGIASSYISEETLDRLTYGFNNAQTQGVFSAGLALFAVVMVLAGRMMPKLGPRKVATAGTHMCRYGLSMIGSARWWFQRVIGSCVSDGIAT